jgi:hypothetical protein
VRRNWAKREKGKRNKLNQGAGKREEMLEIEIEIEIERIEEQDEGITAWGFNLSIRVLRAEANRR